GGTADRNRSHWSTSKTPSYTKSVSWHHHPTPDGRFEALNNKGEYIFIRNSVPGLSSVCIPYHD
ncbi:hypothetical protein, partial [Escherichia coli]|uniref:hypothetical protein n=1 Tax=Escherichia coli TaxID=562 RepID=UPI001F49D8AC